MSHRRVGAPPNGAPRYADYHSLHRCVVALCSNPAVAEGVCELHHSSSRSSPAMPLRGGYSSAITPPGAYMSSSPSSTGYGDDMNDRYRAASNLAMPAQPRATKKQKPNQDTGRSGPAVVASRQPAKTYPPLTQESLNQMNRMKYTKSTPGVSMYDENPFLQRQGHIQESTTGSVHSGDSEHSGDPETNLRRERNRIAARKSRQRKLDRISNLEEEKVRLEQHRDMLVQEIRSLEKKDSGIVSNAVMTITDKEYASLQNLRVQIINAVEEAYNNGDIFSTMQYFRDDSIVSGPQNSSVHLRGKDALVLDYLCTTYLFSDIHLQHVNVDSGGPRSQHFRIHWVFSGVVKSAGVSMNKEFLELIESVKGKRVRIEGVSNFSFSGDKIVYVHRTADQAKFLSAIVNLSKE